MRSLLTVHFPLRWALCAALAGLCLLGADAAADGGIEVQELRAALALSQQNETGLRADLEKAEEQRKLLVESLAEAVRVSEEQFVNSREAQLKLQAFGVDLFTQSEDSLEQRLLKAVRDLDIAQQELERRSSQLHRLTESFLNYVQSTDGSADLKSKESAMAAISTSGKALAEMNADVTASDLQNSSVVSIEPEIGLIIFDAGRGQGVRVGTPITVLRDEAPIYTAMIVDVRDSISGALLQERTSDVESVSIGDGVKLMPSPVNL